MKDSTESELMQRGRREVLGAAWRWGVLSPAMSTGLAAMTAAPSGAVAAVTPANAAATVTPAASLEAAILAFTGGAPVRSGKVKLDIAPLVDNGNTVPLAVAVDHPMRRDNHVSAIAVFSERNPQHEVASFGFGPHNAVARVATRIRLATSQKLVAIARLSDGSHWSGEVDVIVTLAACIED